MPEKKGNRFGEKDGPHKCFNCGKRVSKDYFCSGCREYVCDDCDLNLGLMGPHVASEHLEEE